jgi:inner membrane protein
MLVYGAALGTLPDLDVLVLGNLDAVEQFVRHRSFSHSLFVLSAISLPLAWLLRRLDSALGDLTLRRWSLAVWLTLVTHPLLDAFTVYGTQLWWPLMPPPTSWASIFIIDPLYTLPLLVAVSMAMIKGAAPSLRGTLMLGLALSHGYLAWSVLAQAHVERQVQASMRLQQVQVDEVLASPAPFNTLLWRVLVKTPDGHAEGWVSLLKGGSQPFQAQAIAQDDNLRAELPSLVALETLNWFSHGFVLIEDVEGRLRVSDLRMGAHPDYFFRFDIAERSQGRWLPIRPERVESSRPREERLGEIFDRL